MQRSFLKKSSNKPFRYSFYSLQANCIIHAHTCSFEGYDGCGYDFCGDMQPSEVMASRTGTLCKNRTHTLQEQLEAALLIDQKSSFPLLAFLHALFLFPPPPFGSDVTRTRYAAFGDHESQNKKKEELMTHKDKRPVCAILNRRQLTPNPRFDTRGLSNEIQTTSEWF